MHVRIADPPQGLLPSTESEAHYVVCLLGNAVASPRTTAQGADAPPPPLDLALQVPAGTPTGDHQVRVLALPGGRDPAWIGWRQTIRVGAAGATPGVPVGGVGAGGGALAPDPAAPVLPLAAVAVGGALAAAVVVRRRRSG